MRPAELRITLADRRLRFTDDRLKTFTRFQLVMPDILHPDASPALSSSTHHRVTLRTSIYARTSASTHLRARDALIPPLSSGYLYTLLTGVITRDCASRVESRVRAVCSHSRAESRHPLSSETCMSYCIGQPTREGERVCTRVRHARTYPREGCTKLAYPNLDTLAQITTR